jgi:hypothetical protein
MTLKLNAWIPGAYIPTLKGIITTTIHSLNLGRYIPKSIYYCIKVPIVA